MLWGPWLPLASALRFLYGSLRTPALCSFMVPDGVGGSEEALVAAALFWTRDPRVGVDVQESE